jgi:hypothetical protein
MSKSYTMTGRLGPSLGTATFASILPPLEYLQPRATAFGSNKWSLHGYGSHMPCRQVQQLQLDVYPPSTRLFYLGRISGLNPRGHCAAQKPLMLVVRTTLNEDWRPGYSISSSRLLNLFHAHVPLTSLLSRRVWRLRAHEAEKA